MFPIGYGYAPNRGDVSNPVRRHFSTIDRDASVSSTPCPTPTHRGRQWRMGWRAAASAPSCGGKNARGERRRRPLQAAQPAAALAAAAHRRTPASPTAAAAASTAPLRASAPAASRPDAVEAPLRVLSGRRSGRRGTLSTLMTAVVLLGLVAVRGFVLAVIFESTLVRAPAGLSRPVPRVRSNNRLPTPGCSRRRRHTYRHQQHQHPHQQGQGRCGRGKTGASQWAEGGGRYGVEVDGSTGSWIDSFHAMLTVGM